MKDTFKLSSWPPEFLVERWFTRIHGHKCWDLLCTMEWSSPAHYGKLGDTPNIIGRVRSFQDIKVLGWQIEQFKKKMMFNRHILVPIMSIWSPPEDYVI
jgi:hypothetical protein